MPASQVPRRHWRSYGNDPLPSGKQALDEPLRAIARAADRSGREVIDADQRPHGSWTPTRPPARLLNGALIEGVAATIMQRMPTEEAVGGRHQSRMLIARF
jgi:hypothetical protein